MVQVTGNSFDYTNGNPLSQIDPLGLCNVWAGDLTNIGSDCYSLLDDPFAKQSITTFAGYGDGLTLGLTKAYREDVLDIHNICTDSDEYKYGGYASYLVPTGGVSFKLIKNFRALSIGAKTFGENLASKLNVFKGLTKPIYRGVKPGTSAYEDALKGIVKPRGGTATQREHNLGNTLSEYTSWTPDLSVAKNMANGGVILQTSKLSNFLKLRSSPNFAKVEKEVLIKGLVKKVDIFKIF